MKSQQKRTPAKKPRPKMDNKDSITFDDIEIDLSDYGAAQPSTMIDTLDTITLTGSGSDQYSSINTITLPTFTYGGAISGATVGGITTINNINTNSQWTTGTNGYAYPNSNSFPAPTVNINTDGIEIKDSGDIKIGNQSLKEFMVKMEQRLAILVPDPAKLEKFEALKKAYEHYKTMEALCFDEPKEDEE